MAKQLNVNYRDRLQSAQNLGDSLFQNFSSSQTDESSVIEIELSKLHEFKNHPFKVTDDDKMQELTESIKQNGVLVPAIVRKCDNGEYELISGHRRKHACELAGLTTMPAVIKDYSNDAATIIMVDSNLQREVLLPSEKAKSYAMKYEAMKHQGVQGSGRSIEILGSLSNEGKSTVQRYIWLARLNDNLLQMVDDNILGIKQGADLSFLTQQQQKMVYDIIKNKKKPLSLQQSFQIKKYSQSEQLDENTLNLILEDKNNITRKITLSQKEIDKYFPENYTPEEIEKTILTLLENWKNAQQ